MMLEDLLRPRMERDGAPQIAVILLNALIQQCCRRQFDHHRGLGLRAMNRYFFCTCNVWLDRHGSFQKLGPGIIVGNQFLEQNHEIGDILSFNNCLQTMQ